MSKAARKEPVRKAKKAFREAADGPTPERRARGDIVYGDHEQASQRINSVKTPLDRLRDAGWIDQAQHQAGEKFRTHVYQAGLAGVPKSVDLNATGGGGDCTYGMAANEFQAHHREEYRKAIQAIGSWRCAAFQLFIAHDCPLEEVGYRMGERNKMQAIAAAREMVRGKLVMLAELWGLKSKNAA